MTRQETDRGGTAWIVGTDTVPDKQAWILDRVGALISHTMLIGSEPGGPRVEGVYEASDAPYLLPRPEIGASFDPEDHGIPDDFPGT